MMMSSKGYKQRRRKWKIDGHGRVGLGFRVDSNTFILRINNDDDMLLFFFTEKPHKIRKAVYRKPCVGGKMVGLK